MTKKELLEHFKTQLEDHPNSFFSEYVHEIETIQDAIESALNDYGDCKDDTTITADDLQEDLYSACDALTPIYNHDIMEWLKDNTIAYDETMDEIGAQSRSNVIRQAQQAFCYTLEQEAMSTLNKLLEL